MLKFVTNATYSSVKESQRDLLNQKIKPTTYSSVNHQRLTATQRGFPRRKTQG
jgi:hypothetical protein